MGNNTNLAENFPETRFQIKRKIMIIMFTVFCLFLRKKLIQFVTHNPNRTRQGYDSLGIMYAGFSFGKISKNKKGGSKVTGR